MIAVKRSSWLVFLLTLVSCVTVNIYFPAAAAEQAADQIINDVWQDVAQETSQPVLQQKKAAVNRKSASIEMKRMKKTYILDARGVVLAVVNGFSQHAYAQDVNFNASSPEIDRIKASMGARFSQLLPFLNKGAIGLTSDGFIAVRDASVVSMEERGRMNQLVNAENNDRQQLYVAIAEANNQPGWASQIQNTFAERWILQAQSGWWYQSGGGWVQK